jgi:hypothetical protein
MTIQQHANRLVRQAIHQKAEEFADQASRILDDLTALMGVDGMNEFMRQQGYNVEPDQSARQRAEAA